VEIENLKMPIGKQDQYASAFGSVNAIHFSADEVRVEALTISQRTRDWLSQSILLFFTEQSHGSAEILSEQRRRTAEHDPDTLNALHEIKEHAEEARQALLTDAPHRLGDIMHRSWLAKKRVARGITNARIDGAYDAAILAGASGGKISGAGGGGFLMLACDADCRESVTLEMERHGLVRADFHLETSGARILVNNAAA
jgi:D-glycero-alpha-D-manno-heptose-7-phosphate kinase